MHKYLLFFVLISTSCYANPNTISISGSNTPSLANIPLLTVYTNDNPRYREACYKAQEAFFLQTGATQQINMVAGTLIKKADESLRWVIDKKTPFKSRDVFFAAAVAYSVGIRKRVSQRFKNPIFKNVTHVVDIGKNQQSISVEIPF